jgi:hypothetical protein
VSEARSLARADSLDEQISSLLESIELDVRAAAEAPRRPVREADPPRWTAREAAQPRRKRRPLKASASTASRPLVRKHSQEAALDREPPTVAKALKTRPRHAAKARGLSPPRTRGPLLADAAASLELAFFLGAALIVGAGVGLLVGLFG